MKPLYEVVPEAKRLEFILSEEAYSSEEYDAVLKEYASAKFDMDSKLKGIRAININAEAEIEALKSEENRLKARRKVLEAKIERNKEYLVFCLNGEDWKNGVGSISFRRSPATDDYAPDQIPECYWKTEVVRTLDRAQLLKDLKQFEAEAKGDIVPGARLKYNVSVSVK